MYVFVACLLVSVAWAGPCSFAGVGTNWYATSQPVEEPESCEWYESDSCCKPTFDVDLGTLEDASEDCKDFLRSVLCASCSPSSAIFASTNNQGVVQFKICKSLCADGFDKCKGATINDKVVDDFASSDEFCVSVFYGEDTAAVETLTASGQCFNSGKSLYSVPVAFVFMALLSTYLYF